MKDQDLNPTSPKALSTTQRLLRALDGKPIVLVGMMGAGKTSVGRRLATILGRKFLDSDLEIESAAGKTIEDFFAEHGEEEFREGESKVIKRLLSQQDTVLATGGGAFVNPTTRDIILNYGVSVWIKAEFDLLFARVSRKSNRPLLQTPNPEKTLKDLISARYPIYEKAHVRILSRDVPHDSVANEIIGGLNLFFSGKTDKQDIEENQATTNQMENHE